ncbi:isoprenyl transferase [Bartonella sp. DGB1]|uniref:isoprenyl transferase n=1 Tax=Bartonella sp. DGB1 TaxID=3239807 RepID=UPI003524C243
MPKHIAIIMDGNGRWATERGLSRAAGHEAGSNALSSLITNVRELSIEWLTLFAFSSENWLRPSEEIEDLFALLHQFVKNQLSKIKEENIRIHIIGDRTSLSADILDLLTHSERVTADNTGLNLVIAFNYGARNEIVRAMKKICYQIESKVIKIEDISEKLVNGYLDTHFIPDPDLIIRTSGEMRLSNFLLWQAAYSEFFFSSCYWPDFNLQELELAIDSYRSRNRRFGAIT